VKSSGLMAASMSWGCHNKTTCKASSFEINFGGAREAGRG
jgi:hypothetical protein